MKAMKPGAGLKKRRVFMIAVLRLFDDPKVCKI
jgi:hypothetical protein